MWNPFKKYAEKDQAMRDRLQAAVDLWEANLIAGHYTLLPYAWQVLHTDGGFYTMGIMDEMEKAAWARLRERDDYATLRAGWELENKRVWHPKQYETIKLREEVEALRAKVTQLEGIETMLALGNSQ